MHRAAIQPGRGLTIDVIVRQGEQALCQRKMRYVSEGCDTGDSSRLPFRGRRVTGNGSLLGRWYRRRLLSRGAHAGDEGRVVAHEEAGRVLVLVTHDVEATRAIAVRAFVQRIVHLDEVALPEANQHR